jgi:hypothetical protein
MAVLKEQLQSLLNRLQGCRRLIHDDDPIPDEEVAALEEAILQLNRKDTENVHP